MKLTRLILNFALVTAANAKAATVLCPTAYPSDAQVVSETRFQSGAEFFLRDVPYFLRTNDARLVPVTFSFDSEIQYSEAFRRIAARPDQLATLQSLFDDSTSEGIHRFARLSKLEWSAALKISPRQFDVWALRKGVDRNLATWPITDLNPAYYGQVFAKLNYDHIKDLARIRDFMAVAIADAQVAGAINPFRVHDDYDAVELTHPSSEDIPSSFVETIYFLHREFPRPQTHFHVGLPAEAVTEKQAWTIARVIETRIILGMAMRLTNGRARASYSDFTSLRPRGPIIEEERGAIRLGLSEFSQPVRAHNLEIRQYGSLDEAFELSALAAQLAAHARDLDDFEIFPPDRIDDYLTINCYGALLFAVEAFRKSPYAEDVRLASDLLPIAIEIARARTVTFRSHQALQELLIKKHVLDRLQPSLFFMRRATP